MSLEYFKCLICNKYFEDLCKVDIHNQTHTPSQRKCGIHVQALTFMNCQVVLQRHKHVGVPVKLQPTSNEKESVNLSTEEATSGNRLVRKCRLKKRNIISETESDEELEVKSKRRPSKKRPSSDLKKSDLKGCSDPEKTKICPIQPCSQPCADYYRLLTHLNRHCKAERKENILMSGKESQLGNGEYKDAFYVSKSFHCKVCMGIYPSFKDLQNHLETSHSNNKLKCPYCQENFGISALKLIAHMRAAHPEKIYPFEERKKADKLKCEKCHYTAPCKSKLDRHIKLVHDKIGKARRDSFLKKCQEDESFKKRPWPCLVCPARFNRKRDLQLHFSTHLEIRKAQHVCHYSWCGQKYSHQRGLLYHIKTAHTCKISGNRDGKSRQKPCLPRQRCPTSISKVPQLQPQLNIQTKTEVIDEIHLIDKIILKEHGEAVHLKGEYLTPIAPKVPDYFSPEPETQETVDADENDEELRNRKAALLAVLNDRDVSVEDPIFSKIAKKDLSARLIIQKMKVNVTPQRRFKCSECNMECRRASRLKIHLEKMHQKTINEEFLPKGQVVLMCGKCAYKAKNKTDLGKHLKTHKRRRKLTGLIKDDNQRAQNCGICGDTFAKPESLRKHINRVHLNKIYHKKKITGGQEASCDEHLLSVGNGNVDGDISILGM